MRWSITLIGILCGSARGAEGPPFDGWTPSAARQEIRPEFFVEPETRGDDGKPALAIRHDRREGLDGAWVKSFPIEGGKHYRVSVRRRAVGVPHPTQCAYAQVRWTNGCGALVPLQAGDPRKAQPDLLSEQGTVDGWTAMSDVLRAPPAATIAEVELRLRWSPGA